MNKIQVQSGLSPEIYQQLQAYMTEQGLSETMAIEAIVSSYFADRPLEELTGRVGKVEQELSYLKRQLLAMRFRA
ncbi:MAG TPA: hypothetical protein DCP31_09045 [Cyanobacteria bacterium UBA8543]|nr:hypothetical protein [Cyanobacteria bacterium UBA8543]